MPAHSMSHREVQFEISAEDGIKRRWTVFVDGRATLTGHAVRTIKSSAFRTALQQAHAAIDAMLDDEQVA